MVSAHCFLQGLRSWNAFLICYHYLKGKSMQAFPLHAPLPTLCFSHIPSLTPFWNSAHSPSAPYPACFLPSLKAFLYRDYPKEMLPVLCWKAKIWTRLLVVEQGGTVGLIWWQEPQTQQLKQGTWTHRHRQPQQWPGQIKGACNGSMTPLMADWPCSTTGQSEAQTTWTGLDSLPRLSPGRVTRLAMDSQ